MIPLLIQLDDFVILSDLVNVFNQVYNNYTNNNIMVLFLIANVLLTTSVKNLFEIDSTVLCICIPTLWRVLYSLSQSQHSF